MMDNQILYVWPELTTPKLGGAYSQQPPVRFSFRNLRAVLYLSTAQFLHAKFGKIFENIIAINLRVTPNTEPPNL
jgi:hypothetical protein